MRNTHSLEQTTCSKHSLGTVGQTFVKVQQVVCCLDAVAYFGKIPAVFDQSLFEAQQCRVLSSKQATPQMLGREPRVELPSSRNRASGHRACTARYPMLPEASRVGWTATMVSSPVGSTASVDLG